MQIIIFLGPPGTGKGTLAQECNKQFGWSHISTGALCREYANKNDAMGKEIADKINNGLLIEDYLMIKMLKFSLGDIFACLGSNDSCSNNVILDGFPRNIIQVDLLVTMLREKNLIQHAIFVFFEADKQTIINRLQNRVICQNSACDKIYSMNSISSMTCLICGNSLIKRLDDNSEVVNERLSLYYKTSEELKKYLVLTGIPIINLDASLNKKLILEFFMSKMESFFLSTFNKG